MSDPTEALTHEVGGFPLWAWGGIVVAGVLIGRQITKSMAGSSGVGVLDPLANTGPATGGTAGAVNLAPSVPSGATPKPTTNDEWAKAAVAYLVSSNTALGYRATQVVARYLQGVDLPAADRGLIDAAIGAIGGPPEGAPIAYVIPDPPTPDTPPADTTPPPAAATPPPASPPPSTSSTPAPEATYTYQPVEPSIPSSPPPAPYVQPDYGPTGTRLYVNGQPAVVDYDGIPTIIPAAGIVVGGVLVKP